MNEIISEILKEAHESHTAPGAVVGWIKNGKTGFVASGHLTYESDSPFVEEGTLYDIASITKSIPLSSLVHIAMQEGKLNLTTKVYEIIPELKGKHHRLITIEHLLTYTAIWDISKLSEYALEGAEAIRKAIMEVSLVARPGEKYFYTNAPAIVLGIVIEKIYQKSLDNVAQEKLFEPLEMTHSTFDATPYPDSLVAPSEQGKHGDIHKIVHDESARAFRKSDITSGHAGLFSNVNDLLRYCSVILNGGKTNNGIEIFSDTTLRSFENNYIASISESASLGWELYEPRFMGQYSLPTTFGKTGFTGCVIIIDRTQQVAMVLLTNAQYPKRHTDRYVVNKLRRALADVIFKRDKI